MIYPQWYSSIDASLSTIRSVIIAGTFVKSIKFKLWWTSKLLYIQYLIAIWNVHISG
jgi:hypothetical protein